MERTPEELDRLIKEEGYEDDNDYDQFIDIGSHYPTVMVLSDMDSGKRLYLNRRLRRKRRMKRKKSNR